MEKSIKMIIAVSNVLSYRKLHPSASSEEILRYVSRFISNEKDSENKISMLAAAAKATSIIERKPMSSDREVIKIVVDDLHKIIEESSDTSLVDKR